MTPTDEENRKAYAFIGGLLVLCLLPWFFAQNVVPVLDSSPYVICSVFGLCVGAALKPVFHHPKVVARLPLLQHWLVGSFLYVLVAVGGPSWAIGLGFLANRVLDRSPVVEHRTTMLSIKRSAKGVDSVYLASWRPGEDQVLVPFALGSSLRDIPPSAGTPFYVNVRRGALRFWYVSGARPLDAGTTTPPASSASTTPPAGSAPLP